LASNFLAKEEGKTTAARADCLVADAVLQNQSLIFPANREKNREKRDLTWFWAKPRSKKLGRSAT
jgi:hypothetical protein